MKKKILGLALVAISLVAFNGNAQTTTADNTPSQENVKGKKGDRQGRREKVNPFDGLNLTDAQKIRLQELDKQRREAGKERVKATKEEKQRNDSARTQQRKAAKKSYLEEVKAIIGPEQYVVFLENSYINSGSHRAAHDKAMKQGKKHDKKGMARNAGYKNSRKTTAQNGNRPHNRPSHPDNTATPTTPRA